MVNEFGTTKNGVVTHLYTIMNNNGMTVGITDYGATVVSILTEDKNHVMTDVALGYDCVGDYEDNGYYFGAIIGRNSNRISGGQCVIEGKTYFMDRNHFENNLHSGRHGFDNVVWDVEYDENESNKIVMHHMSKDMEQHLPGNFDATVTYLLDDDNVLSIVYDATTDKTTLANMTTHIYYNLNGHNSGDIIGHSLMIPATKYTPMIDGRAIPKGVHENVSDTPFDFRNFKTIGKDLDMDNEQIGFAGGYDHNFVIDSDSGDLRTVARVTGELSGISLVIESDCEGIQFYSGNGIEEHKAKDGAIYKKRQGFALEPQYIPNAINVKEWKSPILKPGERYHSETKLHFSVEQ